MEHQAVLVVETITCLCCSFVQLVCKSLREIILVAIVEPPQQQLLQTINVVVVVAF